MCTHPQQTNKCKNKERPPVSSPTLTTLLFTLDPKVELKTHTHIRFTGAAHPVS